jgi:hypothetical protein
MRETNKQMLEEMIKVECYTKFLISLILKNFKLFFLFLFFTGSGFGVEVEEEGCYC